MNRLAAPPLSLYIHLPWCVRKCPYCDFNSHEARAAIPQRRYLEALREDLYGEAERVVGRPITSIFIGGGTPSLFSPKSIDDLLASVRQILQCKTDLEVTLEANPGSVEAGRFSEFAAAGVNRLSIGVQSFNDAHLTALGRIHNAATAHDAIEVGASAGFASFNIDLMYALPGQSIADAVADVEAALSHGPLHLSHYELTIEPGTPFARKPPRQPEHDFRNSMLEACQVRLAAAGFERYEVSAYARQGAKCVHNLNYWRYGDYLGIGAGAHSKLTFGSEDRIVRRSKMRRPNRYMASFSDRVWTSAQYDMQAVETSLDVAVGERLFEFMLNALRLVEGVETTILTARTGLELEEVWPILAELEQRSLVDLGCGRIRTTPLGFSFLDDVTGSFLPAD